MNKIYNYAILFLCTLLLPLSVLAKSINLYAEPQDKAKVVSTLDSSTSIIPIFTPEKSDWIKVADPRNGNVGWVKVTDLGTNNNEYTFTQRFINSGSSPQTYQIIQFGGPHKMTSGQVQDILKKNEAQQQQLQENMNKSIQKMINDISNMYNSGSSWFNNQMPFIVPVIVVPTQNIPGTESKSPEKNSAKSK